MDENLSVAQAAVRLGVSTDAIRKRLARGTLQGDKVDGVWSVRIEGAPLSGHNGAPGQTVDTSAPVAGQPVDASGQQPDTSGHTADTGALATVIADLAKQNAQLSAAAAMWQERARGLEERLMQLSPGTITETDTPQSPVSDDLGTTGISTHVEPPAPRASAWGRLIAWLRHDAG